MAERSARPAHRRWPQGALCGTVRACGPRLRAAPAGEDQKRGPGMAKEIERKFLVAGEGWRNRATGSRAW